MHDIAPITDLDPTETEMAQHLVRFADARPTGAYADSLIPGFGRITWSLVGATAPIPAGDFHLNLIRCAPGSGAPLHSHLTREFFMPLSGTWEVFWGPEGQRSLRLAPFDLIAVPPLVSRGFRNVGTEEAMLLGIAEKADPGRISWPESVHAAARAAGVSLG